jgi:hypothetical protein
MKKITEPYHHIRFRWWTRVEPEIISEELGEPGMIDATVLGFRLE